MRRMNLFGLVLAFIAICGTIVILARTSRRPVATIVADSLAAAGPARGHLLGREDAPVRVDEFGDFECPHCAEFARTTEPELRTKLVNSGVVAFRYYDFPLARFKNSVTAHLAASCAEEQGKFWEMHDSLYAAQDRWNTEATSDPLAVMSEIARELGLDVGTFRTCVTTEKPAAAIAANHAEGLRRGVKGTPTFFAGRRMFNGVPYPVFKAIVDSALAEQPRRQAPQETRPRR